MLARCCSVLFSKSIIEKCSSKCFKEIHTPVVLWGWILILFQGYWNTHCHFFLHKTNSFSIIVIVIITLQEMQLSYSQTLITRLMAETNSFLLKKSFYLKDNVCGNYLLIYLLTCWLSSIIVNCGSLIWWQIYELLNSE